MAADARVHVMGLFKDEGRAAKAVADLKAAGFVLERVHSPVPSHRLMEALGLKKSPVGWFTLAGGVIGFFTGFLLAAFTATQWNLIVSGKPVVALVPFFVVGFEFTILFSVFGNVIGLLVLSRLPGYGHLRRYDPRCSGEHYGVTAACPPGRRAELADFFQNRGGEARVFE
jgi:molybdopterin-containing oxidoreductase family membrane subunit